MHDAGDVDVNIFFILVMNVVHDSVVHFLLCTSDKNHFMYFTFASNLLINFQDAFVLLSTNVPITQKPVN